MADDKKIIFSMVGVSKVFPPQKQVLKNIYLSFFYGAKIGIIGLNGSGKSTLLKIIAGVEKEYHGEVVFSPGYSVGYLEQEPKLEPGKTVKEVVQEGVQNIVDTLKEYEEVNEKFGDPEILEDPDKMDALINRQAELQDKIDATDAWNLDSRLERAMDALRCPPEDQVVDTLSGGERRRVALCRLLLQQPDILLLDEPTNHLDAESIDWLEQHLQQYTGTVICITHDRYFLDHVAGWILELDRGEGIPWKGNYSSWLDQKTKRMAQEEKQASKRRKTLERELEWINMAPKARQAKGKARLNSYEALLNEDQKEREAKLEIFIPNGPRLGNKVIEAQHVAKAFGDKLLFDDLNFMLPPNGIVGVIGPNGAGKTTLFKMIMGMESIDKGSFEVGETVKIGYADQTHKDIDPKKTVYQVVSGGQEFIRVEAVLSGEEKRITSETVPAHGACRREWLEEFSEMEHGAQNWLDEVIGTLPHALTPDTPLRMASEGNALADLFNAVQLWASGAQLSATSLANDVAGLPKTERRRDHLIAYPYTTALAVLEITGKVLKAALERSAEYFSRGEDGRLCVSDVFLRPKVEHYNYDYYAGVSYVYDISRPVGERVTSMRVNGQDVREEDTFTICLNSYRASGTGGYDFYVGCPVVREIGTEMADLILDCFKEFKGNIPAMQSDFRVI